MVRYTNKAITTAEMITRLLDYLRSCVVFEEDERGNIAKKVAGYHQFRAVQKTRAQVRARGNGIGLGNPALAPDSARATDVPAASPQPALSTIIPAKVLQKKANESETVYITRTGHKYHRGGCRSLSRSQIPITLSEAKQQGYGPCAICGPPM